MLNDIYYRLYWNNSGLVRKYEPNTTPKKGHIVLKSNSLIDQLQLQIDLETIDNELINYFIYGGEVENEWIIYNYYL